MTLATVVAIWLMCPYAALPGGYAYLTQDSASQQAPGSSSKSTAQSQSSTPSGQGQGSGTTAKPAPTKPKRHKATNPNCVDTTTTDTKPKGTGPSASANTTSTALKPCPAKKTVIRNGGTTEPAVRLTGTDPAKQASQATTAQLLAGTEENLKKLAGRDLNADQQQTLTQIHEFVEQSKHAAAAGDMEQAQNLASKARLLSDELVKP
jgi:hypothetical protein